ncbi:MAG: TIGR04283 family arsenosugar biosynthesis glycosyltransferase [Acidiferrobacterales bacterium]
MKSTSLPGISIVIPVYNENKSIDDYIDRVLSITGDVDQVVIVDGTSNDGTFEKLNSFLETHSDNNKVKLYRSEPGRARQMNFGAEKCFGDAIIFLHVDTTLPDDGIALVQEKLKNGAYWGRFDVKLDAEPVMYRVIETIMNWRSACTSIATGDQAIFVRTDVFKMINGFPVIPLMEDIAISNHLKTVALTSRIKSPVLTSARRWQDQGVWPTILLMSMIRLAFWFGIKPERLARWYRKTS